MSNRATCTENSLRFNFEFIDDGAFDLQVLQDENAKQKRQRMGRAMIIPLNDLSAPCR